MYIRYTVGVMQMTQIFGCGGEMGGLLVQAEARDCRAKTRAMPRRVSLTRMILISVVGFKTGVPSRLGESGHISFPCDESHPGL